MKTQILQLEAHDDVVSILDKIGWAQTERVLLVLPRRRRILQNKLDLLRLKRYSQKRGCQLALVTDDPLIKALAREINLPIFRSIQKAHQLEWQTTPSPHNLNAFRESVQKPSLSAQIEVIQSIRTQNNLKAIPIWARILWFLMGILAIIGVLSVLVPRATLSIKPAIRTQTMNVPMIATRAVQQARLSGEVPITNLRVIVSGRKTKKVTGSMSIPKDFAKGEVVLTNLTDQTISVPLGTIVRTLDSKPRRYATQESITLMTGEAKSARVVIQALEAGASQNAQPHEIKAVEGFLGLKVNVDNPQAIQGGSNMIAPAPSKKDRDLLLQELKKELLKEAKTKVSQQIQAGDLLLPDSAVQFHVVKQQFIPEDDNATDSLVLDLEVEVTFAIVERQSLTDLGDQLLTPSLPNGYVPLPNTFSAVCRDDYIQTEKGNYQCNLEISRQIQPKINPEQVRSLIAGKSIQRALQILQQRYQLSEPPQIEILPTWFPFIPLLPMQMEIVIK